MMGPSWLTRRGQLTLCLEVPSRPIRQCRRREGADPIRLPRVQREKTRLADLRNHQKIIRLVFP